MPSLWYREHGRPVDIVIPSYRDSERVRTLVRSISKTAPKGMLRIIVADDCSGPEHLAALGQIKGIDVLVPSEENLGFAANTNRGIRASEPDRDIVVLNSDIEALPSWLQCLQYAAHSSADVGIVGAQLQYPDGRIQFGGTVRNRIVLSGSITATGSNLRAGAPPRCASPALAVTGACMYVRRELIERIGLLDERYPMAYEDVDWCLRAWQAGFQRALLPRSAQLVHHESVTRGTELGERERDSQRLFWERWSDFFDARSVGAPAADGRLRIVYVTEDTGVGGGHRDIFEHLNRLSARGHDVSLYTLGESPDWFQLRVPVRSFAGYHELADELSLIDAIKVATWWMTAAPVWQASIVRGLPVYFVQDIETSYYPDAERGRHAVLDSYRPEFRYMTISSWNRERLRELGLDAELIPPGIDLETFRPLAGVQRREDMVLALGRSNPLKNLPLTIAAWKALKDRAGSGQRPELCLFGVEPELARDGGMAAAEGVRYVDSPGRRARGRAVQPGDRLRPDLLARGLRAAAAGGDGDRRRRALHRRARQPRLLPRRRQLPDATGEHARGQRRACPSARRPRAARAPGSGRHRDGEGLRVGAAHRRSGDILPAGRRRTADGGCRRARAVASRDPRRCAEPPG